MSAEKTEFQKPADKDYCQRTVKDVFSFLSIIN